jgi:hypothetical protein
MNSTDILTLIVSVIGAIGLPIMILLLRGLFQWTRTWTKTEEKLSAVAKDLAELMAQKDSVHAALYDQMRVDREATDRRLRFIEEWFMRGGGTNAQRVR